MSIHTLRNKKTIYLNIPLIMCSEFCLHRGIKYRNKYMLRNYRTMTSISEQYQVLVSSNTYFRAVSGMSSIAEQCQIIQSNIKFCRAVRYCKYCRAMSSMSNIAEQCQVFKSSIKYCRAVSSIAEQC